MAMYNKQDGRILKANLATDPVQRKTISFYKYHQLADPQAFRDSLFLTWDEIGVKGRVYIAAEGINAQISVPLEAWSQFQAHLDSVDWLRGVRLNVAVEDNGKSFFKLTIKVRPKILADGLEDASFDVTNKGQHLDAAAFNELISQNDTVLIDMRNHYETEVGHFKGAITPDVDTFRDSLPVVENLLREHVEKHIVMYCTGGIRCEKASAWFKHRGFKKVYQLEGGIIKYAHDVQEQGLENLFVGKNFVFDERLGERISDEVIAHCHQCGALCDTHTNCANVTCNLLFIQCDTCAQRHEGCCSSDCQSMIQLPEAEQQALRKGKDSGVRIFSKGRPQQQSAI